MDLPLADLDGTAASLAAAAARAGYSVRAETNGQSIRLGGVMHGWAFSAVLTAAGGWNVGIRRPGWPDALSDVTALRRTFSTQTPKVLGRAR